MKYSNIPSAQMMVQYCRSRGIRNIVISPGSRNAPLTITFTEDPYFNCFSIVDERCAAFFALGMALHQQEPTAILCTSGSALLNYYPAIAEAFYSNIPLVAISADRPPYKIDIGDGQTIRQDNIFNRHIAYTTHLKLDVSHQTDTIQFFQEELLKESQDNISQYNESEIVKALDVALNDKMPVHINIPFEEPLYDTVLEPLIRDVKTKEGSIASDIGDISRFRKLWNASKRKMVLVGVNHPYSIDKELLDILGNDPTVLVFTETTSNLHHKNFFPSIDSIIFPIEKSERREELFKALRPDILLTFGGLIVSKKIKAFLRRYKPEQHWHIDERRANNTFYALTHHFKSDPNAIFKTLLSDSPSVKSNYFENWNVVKQDYLCKREEYLATLTFSDFLAFSVLMAKIPKKYQVHLANSSTVRYAQLFDMHPSLKVFCNRGTSGIEGSTSTALGAAMYEDAPTLLITGDLAFFYDSNALWNKYVKNNFRIILINNSGGGIFRILPGSTASENFATYFETKHEMTAKHVCAQFGFDYATATDREELENQLKTFFEPSESPRLLEVFTPRNINDKILLDYFDFIS